MRSIQYALAVVVGLAGWAALGADGGELTEPKQKFAYGIGMSLGNNLKRSGIAADQVDVDSFVRGLRDVLAGNPPALSEADARTAITEFQAQARTQLGEKNKTAGQAFLAENKTKEGVKVLPVTLPTGQTAELQYKVLTEGKGDSPKANDTVTVNYRGTLIDGTEFDSSYKRGQPATFGVSAVIRGWTEALQKMAPGAKWQLFIPPELAYGERGSGAGVIGPGATLLFDVELISVKPAPAATASPAGAQPVTSDIIKVPSKEELEKGAKIEVIKASDVEKIRQQEKEKAEKAKARTTSAAPPPMPPSPPPPPAPKEK
ncbi:MAG TPA: FKBP-type peptidyl-prolyl cis-trans isomerase [Verrucomicrobiota bacterium]|nr:FKBP-type peptidyl-prolyl cis-trans isomerase [Verrucomicrobiota bacterium]HNU49698.1 FKBP-type peptidyl-prolyl cis-trans isomerase [Verrucomicrobiota bacterium]